MGRKGLLVGALVVTAIAVGCGDDGGGGAEDGGGGGGESGAAEFSSPEALADALTDAGFECTDLEPSESLTGDQESASCPFGSGDELFVAVYTDEDAVREGIALGQAFICDEGFGQAGNTLSFAVGPNWTVTAPTIDEAEAIAEALNAEVETIEC